MDDQKPSAQAIAIKADRIFKVGTNEELDELKKNAAKTIDLKGTFVMPGFIEGHGHYSGLGKSLINLNFLKSKSWEEIVQQVAGVGIKKNGPIVPKKIFMVILFTMNLVPSPRIIRLS